MDVVVRRPQIEDHTEWTRMRVALWPECTPEGHAQEIAAYLTGNLTGWLAPLQAVAAFVAARPGGGLCGFLEASVRPMADGCVTHPVGYVEGWYVDVDVRKKAVARALLRAAEEWASLQGCREMASDTHLANHISIAAHKAVGFSEESPVVRFHKQLPLSAGKTDAAVHTLHNLTLIPVKGAYAICRLEADTPLAAWLSGGPFLSVTRTSDELSIVCDENAVPQGVRCERGWRCLRGAGTLDFSLVGIVASMVNPLAHAGIGVFVVSTFDTDYLLLKEENLGTALKVLLRHGHRVVP